MLYLDVSVRLPQINELDIPPSQSKIGRQETRRRSSLRVQSSTFLQITTYLLLFFLCVDLLLVSSQPSAKPRSYIVKTKNTHLHVRRCKVFSNQVMHNLMDKVCGLCHDIFSHVNPNMRSDCRSNCFKSEHFSTCLNIFNKYGTEITRDSKHLLTTIE